MKLDGHIHSLQLEGCGKEKQADLLARMERIGISGGLLLSVDPLNYPQSTCQQRIDAILEQADGQENLFPFYWINPLDEDAVAQVDYAAKVDIDGFKIINSFTYPSDPRVMAVCRRAAELDKPVLFHTGILWDGRDSARYNRPAEYECLLEIPRLRFMLAHISWPWCDECVAVLGKFDNAKALRPDLSCEMFVDVTPGTPMIFREDALKKLFFSGYDSKYSVVFGTDCNTEKYNTSWAEMWMHCDNGLYEKFGLADSDFLDHIYRKNLLRFLGKSDEVVVKKLPVMGE